jgi:hypothetical protein
MSAPPAPVTRETISVAPGTLVTVALAFAAIAIVLLWTLRSQNSAAVSTAPVPVATALITALPANAPHKSGKPHPKPHPSTSPSPAVVAQASASDQSAATTAPHPASASTPVATPHASSAGRPATHQAAVVPQRVSPVDRSAIVQLDSVGADYQRGGRLVHVYWNSYAQAHADVQLLDDRSTLLAETTVGRRMAALLWLPRGYRGSLFVQVTAIGYDGTRVESSASLGPP